jgi:O-methyltransferase involved in polyketide biosynthesis
MGNYKIDLRGLGRAAETMLFPLYFLAVENQRPDPIARDEIATDLRQKLDYDFSKAQRIGFDQVLALMRMREFDGRVRVFQEQYPSGCVVETGCGLDTRSWRVDGGALEWYELDLPDVIAVQAQLLLQWPRRCLIGYPALDFSWMEQIPRTPDRPFLFVAEGVFSIFQSSPGEGAGAGLERVFPRLNTGFRCPVAFHGAAGEPDPGAGQDRCAGAMGAWG